jgi:hypothetical protein
LKSAGLLVAKGKLLHLPIPKHYWLTTIFIHKQALDIGIGVIDFPPPRQCLFFSAHAAVLEYIYPPSSPSQCIGFDHDIPQ